MAEQELVVTGFLSGGVRCNIEMPVAIHKDDDFKVKKKRKHVVTQIVVHENVGPDHDVLEDEEGEEDDRTEKTLEKKGLGLHFMIGIPDDDFDASQVVQHNDLHDLLFHAGPLNTRSIGIEIINPYYPPASLKRLPWKHVIDAKWAHKKRYLLPTQAQMECLWRLVRGICDSSWPGGIEIPMTFVGADDNRGRLLMGMDKGIKTSTAGVWAHGYNNHADGFFPVLYCWLRSRFMDPDQAYLNAVAMAKKAGRWASLL